MLHRSACPLTIVAACALSLLTSPMLGAPPAGDVPGAKDNPQVKRVNGSRIVLYRSRAFDEMYLPLEPVIDDDAKVKEAKRLHVEGAHTILYYLVPPDVSPYEVVHQYAADLKEQNQAEDFWLPDSETPLVNTEHSGSNSNFAMRAYPDVDSLGLYWFHSLNSADQHYGSFKGKSANGGDLYVSVLAMPFSDGTDNDAADFRKALGTPAKGQTIARVDIFETRGTATRMGKVKAEEITDSLVKTGRAAIYGVYFDADKADLKPESKEALAEMAKAIQAASPGKKFLIVGHTDNQGEYGYNLDLSIKRAKAVTEALLRDYGLTPGSVIPMGVGMAAPVAPNTDETGRAKNRRVEIVAM